jgi:dipeptidyl aminopeptidase/acylaminoacyl peptidase
VAYLANHKLDWVVTSDLMLSPAAGGPPRNLTPEFEESVKEFEWSGGHVVFSAGDRTVNRFYSVDLDTGVLRPLTHGDSVYSQLSLSADGKRCAFVMQDSITPPDVYVSEVADFRPRRVSNINPQLEQWTLVPAEVIRWKSFDGMEIEGLLHKPAAWRRGQPVPLLVVPHGGPHAAMTNTFPGHETLYFLSRGWAVFRPNFRGSGNYGERFLRANLYGWGLGDFQDLMTGVDALIASGVADRDRMAISGASYGGYMTSWTIGQSMRFRAAIVGCAITDLPSFIRTTDVPERFESYLGIDPALYLRHSPLAFGERMKTPALIWHGDQDARVPLMQSRHLYTQLLKNRVPVDLVVYPGEAHGLRRPGFQADLLERESAWLQYYVLNKGSDPAAGFSTRPYGIQ